jgi:hypothetical protein
MQIESKPFQRTSRAAVRRATPPAIDALLMCDDVQTATWEAYLSDVPMTWLPRRPVVETPLPVGEAEDSDFGAFVEAAGADRELAALRRKLHAWELQHLREHVEELREQLDAALAERDRWQDRAHYAEDLAESWREDALRAIEDAGAMPGLTLQGRIVAVEQPRAAS